MKLLRTALSLMTLRLMLLQIGLALLVFLLSVLWLRLPDAGAIDVAGTVLLAILIAAVACGGEAWLILNLAPRPRTRTALLRGAIFLLIGVVLWMAWGALIDRLRIGDQLRAGYLNSKFPHTLRNLFSYEHIVFWLSWAWSALAWIGAGILPIFVFAGIAAPPSGRIVATALRSAAWWIVLIAGSIAATALTGALLHWTPGHRLLTETISLVLRLALAVLIDAALLCLLLVILAACAREADALYLTSAGTPDESHPRTAEGP